MEYLNSWSFFETSKEHGIKQAVKKKKFLASPINYNYKALSPMSRFSFKIAPILHL